eukprot:13559151-Ditylum_brightwellii.AAC.1
MRTGNLTQLIHKYESLDNSITEAMLATEKECCKSKYRYAWSLKLVQAGKQVRYWKTCKSSLNNKIEVDHMFHLAKHLEITDDPSLTRTEVDERLTNARKELRLVQLNAAAL